MATLPYRGESSAFLRSPSLAAKSPNRRRRHSAPLEGVAGPNVRVRAVKNPATFVLACDRLLRGVRVRPPPGRCGERACHHGHREREREKRVFLPSASSFLGRPSHFSFLASQERREKTTKKSGKKCRRRGARCVK